MLVAGMTKMKGTNDPAAKADKKSAKKKPKMERKIKDKSKGDRVA